MDPILEEIAKENVILIDTSFSGPQCTSDSFNFQRGFSDKKENGRAIKEGIERFNTVRELIEVYDAGIIFEVELEMKYFLREIEEHIIKYREYGAYKGLMRDKPLRKDNIALDFTSLCRYYRELEGLIEIMGTQDPIAQFTPKKHSEWLGYLNVVRKTKTNKVIKNHYNEKSRRLLNCKRNRNDLETDEKLVALALIESYEYPVLVLTKDSDIEYLVSNSSNEIGNNPITVYGSEKLHSQETKLKDSLVFSPRVSKV
ncbi:MAG: hypothetical protein Q7S74_00950 [Nanoarchaeota archaeon]|nr:hypothetical protein [Nanoarchaeota archaeon]